MYMTNNVMI